MRNNFYIILSLVVSLLVFSNFLSSQTPIISTDLQTKMNQCLGDDLTLTVVVEGDVTFSYKWYKDKVEIVGANTSQYNIPSVAASDAGSYICEIFYLEDTLKSNNCDLRVDLAVPSNVSVTNSNTTICYGTSATLKASLEGSITHLEWYKDNELISSNKIINARETDEGQYHCVAVNSCGSSEPSSSIEINVIKAPSILQDLDNIIVCEGSEAVLTAVVGGDELEYKWYKADVIIPGEISQTFSLPDVVFPQNSFYKYEVSNLCGTLTSTSVLIKVNTPPKIQGQPLPSSACYGNVELTVSVSSNIEPSYQWYKMPDVIIDGAKQNSIEISVQEDEDLYFCKLTNECAVVYSDTVSVVKKNPPQFLVDPQGASICEGAGYEMYVKTVGQEPITIEWFKDNATVNMANVSASNFNPLSISGITQANAGTYRCKASNECAAVYSENAVLNVLQKPYFTSQPSSKEVCEGSQVSFDIQYGGSENIEFEWNKEGNDQILTTDNGYVIDDISPDLAGTYFCTLSNICGSSKSEAAEIVVLLSPQITKHPEDLDVCVGEPVEMSIEIAEENSSIAYLWYKNGQAVSSQTNPSLFYEQAQTSYSGEYFCKVIGQCGDVNSEAVNLKVSFLPSITKNPVAIDVCEKQELKLEINVNNSDSQKQWYHNNLPISGANSLVLLIPSASLGMSGDYFCKVSNSCGDVESVSVNVNVNPSPNLDLGPDKDLCEGESITIGPISETYQSYVWNEGLSTSPSLEVMLSGVYTLEVTQANGCSAKDVIEVRFHPYHKIQFPDTDVISCGPYELDAGAGAYAYSWSVGNVISSSLLVLESGNYSVTTTGDSFGCLSSKSINVEIREPIDFSLGDDIVAPVNSIVEIGVDPIYESYLWNNGFTGPKLTVYGNLFGVGEHEFELTVVAESGCTKSDKITITFISDNNIADKEISKINIFPNPAKDYVIIDSFDENIKEIELINILGQVLFRSEINANKCRLELNNYQKGVYFIKITGENNNIVNAKIKIL